MTIRLFVPPPDRRKSTPYRGEESGTEVTSEFIIGSEAACADGVCGHVSQVVVDPLTRIVTHLVVEPEHRQGLGRLVRLSLLDTSTAEVRLRCTLADFDRLDHAEETLFLPGSGYAGYGPGQSLLWPYYGFGMGNLTLPVTTDTLPLGEVSVRRGDPVRATDGDIGRMHGLVVDPHTHRVTHVLLQEGHVWGRKQLAIPIRSVTAVDDAIQVDLTKQQLQDLPEIDVDHPIE